MSDLEGLTKEEQEQNNNDIIKELIEDTKNENKLNNIKRISQEDIIKFINKVNNKEKIIKSEMGQTENYDKYIEEKDIIPKKEIKKKEEKENMKKTKQTKKNKEKVKIFYPQLENGWTTNLWDYEKLTIYKNQFGEVKFEGLINGDFSKKLPKKFIVPINPTFSLSHDILKSLTQE